MSRGPTKVVSFLRYAAASWPFHLQESVEVADQETVAALEQFFSAHCVLTWVYLLAVGRDLKVLVYAAKVLSSFIRVTNKFDESRNPMMHRIQGKDLLATWATDLLRLVGKFAPQLVSNPKLISGLIPSFCPPDSAIRRQFGASNSASTIEICGLANTSWDECVAKFAAPNNQTPLGIRCTSKYLAMMMRDGTVVLTYSDTLEEARRVNHGERVSAWAFNHLGDKLATSSLSHTTVWNSSTTKELFSIQHLGRIKPLTMSFAANDTCLVICTDDWQIRRAYLNVNDDLPGESDVASVSGRKLRSLSSTENAEESLHWQILEGALGPDLGEGRRLATPHCVRFNLDDSLVAVTYRELELSVCSLQGPYSNLVARCRRLGHFKKFHSTSGSGIQAICWNNATVHVLGLVRDARRAFKWHPYSGEYVESSSFRVGTVACSSDGKFFVTGSQDGSLKVWDFHHFSIVYRLSCNILVTDLAIDPEGARIYVIREKFCSAWNPNALIRMWEVDDRANNDTSSTQESSVASSLISEYSHTVSQPVTSIAYNYENFGFAAGDEEGNVTQFTAHGEKVNFLGKSFMTVKPMSWSDDGKFLAYSDLARQIMVESLTLLESAEPTSYVLRAKETQRITQLLVSPDNQQLLVASDRFVNVWSIDKKTRSSTRSQVEPVIWVSDPNRADRLIGFGNSSIHVTPWKDLLDVTVVPLVRDQDEDVPFVGSPRRLSSVSPMSPTEIQASVDKILLTVDGSKALIQLSKTTAQQHRNRWAMIIPSSLPKLSSGHHTESAFFT